MLLLLLEYTGVDKQNSCINELYHTTKFQNRQSHSYAEKRKVVPLIIGRQIKRWPSRISCINIRQHRRIARFWF